MPEQTSRQEAGMEAIESATWLGRGVLVLVGRLGHESAAPPDGIEVALGEDGERKVASRSISFEARSHDGPARLGHVVTVFVPRAEEDLREAGLTIASGAATLRLTAAELTRTETDLATLARRSLAALDAATRTRILTFLASTATAFDGADGGGARVSRSLQTLREALRERTPRCVVSEEHAQGLCADSISALGSAAFWIEGWMRDGEAPIARLTAVSPEGHRAELLPDIYRYRRPDVEQFYGTPDASLDRTCGFASFFTLDAPSSLPEGWLLELENADGDAVEVEIPAVVRDPIAVRDRIIAGLGRDHRRRDEFIGDHVFPALSVVQDELHATAEIEAVDRYGDPPADPDVSIVVPLYQRIDLVEQQLAEFARDPEIAGADLVYVLDSPELEEALRAQAAQLHEIYRVPFRVVAMRRNVGFAGANNAGASQASGRLLLLFNSDVLPARPGWLGTMRDFYDRTPDVGALGAKLLFEDDTLQHAGIYFARPPGSPTWENQHYYKGMHRSLPAANVARRVPAVTGACMMVAADLYERLGGLRGAYVQGDYEDTDLCLRLAEEGFDTWYAPTVELYHLEGQSYALESRMLNAQYNTWVHTRLWGDRIERTMERAPAADGVAT